MADAMFPDPKKYWQDTDIGGLNVAPNSALFRFFGSAGFDFAKKRVLEVGFFRGADLIEARKRGADVYGVDINLSAVEAMVEKFGPKNFAKVDLGVDPVPFSIEFDAIFALDMIYYLSDDEILTMARNCFDVLHPSGCLVVQFIQSDWVRSSSSAHVGAIDQTEWMRMDRTFAKGNPIRILEPENVANLFEQAGGRLGARKTMTETYGIDEKYMRCTRFFMFNKANGAISG